MSDCVIRSNVHRPFNLIINFSLGKELRPFQNMRSLESILKKTGCLYINCKKFFHHCFLSLQPSWYVQSLLFHLCLEVNRVGGHALPKVTLLDILRSCLDQVVSEYERLTQKTQSKVRRSIKCLLFFCSCFLATIVME